MSDTVRRYEPAESIGDDAFADLHGTYATDRITFALTRWNRLAIAINGESLIDMVRRVELPLATWEGNAALAGCWNWLLADDLVVHSNSFHAELSADDRREDGRLARLACGACGFLECDSIVIRMRIEPDVAIWDRFGRSSRPKWKYPDLEFCFDRGDYDVAVEDVRRELTRRIESDSG